MEEHKRDSKFYIIHGSERKLHPSDEIIGRAYENKIIHFQIYLKDKFKEEKLKNFEKMADLLPSEREYLNPEEFESKYGADEKDIEKVKIFAKEYGLKIEDVIKSANKIKLSGKIGSINKAFKVTLQNHKDQSGAHIGREGSIYVPDPLKDIVRGVYGLSRRRMLYPFIRPSKLSRKFHQK